MNAKIQLYFVDAYKHEKKLALSQDGKILWVVDRQEKADILKKFDLENQGTIVEIITNWMPNADVKSIYLMGMDK